MNAAGPIRTRIANSDAPWARRVKRTGTAVRYLRRLVRPGADGYQLAEINALQDLVDNGRYERMARRAGSTPSGAQLLATRPSFYDAVALEELERLPEGTLGGAFARFMRAHGLQPNIAVQSAFPASADAEFVKARHRESHDLVHVLLALGIEPREEVLVQAFTLGQNARWVSLAIVLGGLVKHGRLAGEAALFRAVIDAYRVGRDASFVLVADWESMWSLSLNEVRARLGLRVVPTTPN